MRTMSFFVLSMLSMLSGCGTEGDGTITVTAYGESFIEDGIPAAEVDDGWTIDFARFEVGIRDVSVAGARLLGPITVDLSRSSSAKGHELGSKRAPEGAYTGSAFTIVRVEVDGMATKDAVTKTFNWVFDKATRYAQCETTTETSDNGRTTFQITVHADHLFGDSLVADQPRILFQALADADTDDDGSITQAELVTADIGAYDPGNDDGVDDLWAWLEAQTRTLGHVDGEGHCQATAASD